ncbi:DUF1178 family protein [Xanthobacter oligotrophicus]|uniref:DUF1178 family protein n=1 Tax=Xanthobacter oligotrophicus TaxID=2607286 RepID=UPI0011F3B59D|nr:DUF1178 family protein [Xanthobacter oligotrophicus]MCG5236054.1 DUF1178 family protein [Xanthobacter oligotrophicus]
MIRYTLNCAAGHQFESWFPSSASFDAQQARGLVTCPTCRSPEVQKAVMAPSVARTDRAPAPAVEDAPSAAGAPVAAPAPAPAEAPVPVMSHPDGELRALIRELREQIVKTSDYVGDEFADLARKMHDGEIEHRSIYGEATVEEVKALREDDVEVLPLPVLPEDRN